MPTLVTRARQLLRRRPGSSIAAGALVAAVVAVGIAYWPYHFLTVEEGVLYRSGYLPPHQARLLLPLYGIKTVVSLVAGDDQLPQGRVEREIAEELGIERIVIPMPPDTPPTDAQQRQWLELLADESKHPILVHCQHGVIRTGMMVTMYEVEYRDRSGADVLADMPLFGHDIDRPWRGPVRDFIRSYRARGNASAAPDS